MVTRWTRAAIAVALLALASMAAPPRAECQTERCGGTCSSNLDCRFGCACDNYRAPGRAGVCFKGGF